ncbi:MAG: DNA-directed RNA polymerase subunit omega [Clostridiales bacterium]|nr:DNA-directed RNA polymerase subunit omega [Clostridiales bacterium]
MLVKPPMEKLLTKAENRYTLAILVAKRARQLVDGAQPLTDSDSPNLVTLACEELADDTVRLVRGHVNPHIPLRPEIEAARLAARNARLMPARPRPSVKNWTRLLALPVKILT